MNIRYLKIFLAVVDNKTMNAAAKVLNIAQPSISQAIQEMEHYYGVKLFDRLNRHLYLTPVGAELLSFARYIVSNFDDMEIFLKNSAQNPILRIGSTATFSTCFLSNIAARMQALHPNISMDMVVTNTATVGEKLLSSQLDLGIVEGQIDNPDILRVHLLTDHVILVCSRTHPFYGKKICFQDLDGQDFISREETSYLRNRFDSMARKRSISYREAWRCSGSEAIKAAVAAGQGIAVLSAVAVKEELEKGLFYALPISDANFDREVALVHHKNKFLSPALNTFIHVCRDYLQEALQNEDGQKGYILP